MRDILARYGNRIGFWEVVNEPSLLREPRTNEPYRWAREADARAYQIVNDHHVDADGRVAFRGFLGTYRLVVESSAGRQQQPFTLARDGPPQIVLTLPGRSR